MCEDDYQKLLLYGERKINDAILTRYEEILNEYEGAIDKLEDYWIRAIFLFFGSLFINIILATALIVVYYWRY